MEAQSSKLKIDAKPQASNPKPGRRPSRCLLPGFGFGFFSLELLLSFTRISQRQLTGLTLFTGFRMKPGDSDPVNPVGKTQRHSASHTSIPSDNSSLLMPSGAYGMAILEL